MAKICDNKSVGILVWNENGGLLLIERKKYNFGFAPPAGHLDDDSWEEAAGKELKEEAGLKSQSLKPLLEMELQNPCRRSGGDRHLWRVYKVEGLENQNITLSADETKSYLWADAAKLRALAARLEEFARESCLSFDHLPILVAATNESSSWMKNPGLEPPWYLLLKELKII